MSRLTTLSILAIVCETQAQSAAPEPAPAATREIAPSERAKRDAEKVFQWIRIHSDKPRKPSPAAEKAAPVAASPATSAKTAKPAKPAEKGVTEVVNAPAVAAPARADIAAPPKTEAAAPREREPQAAAAATPPRHDPASTAPAPAAPATMSARTPSAAQVVAAAPVIDEVTLKPVYKTDPEFPGHLMRTLRKGMVQVSFTVQPDGSVAQAQAVSSTHPRLAQAAVATVSQWRFEPVRRAQQAIVDLGFNLD